MLQYAAARVISNTGNFDRGWTHLLHSELHWLDVPQRILHKLGLTVHWCLQGKASQYLVNCCHPTSDVASSQRLRSSSCHHLVVPRHRRSMLGYRAFSVAGPMAWNALPDDLRDPSLSADNFRKTLKTHLFRNALGHLAHSRHCVMRCINLRVTYLLTYGVINETIISKETDSRINVQMANHLYVTGTIRAPYKLCEARRREVIGQLVMFFSFSVDIQGWLLLACWSGMAQQRTGEFVEGFLESIIRLLVSGWIRKSIPVCDCPVEKMKICVYQFETLSVIMADAPRGL